MRLYKVTVRDHEKVCKYNAIAASAGAAIAAAIDLHGDTPCGVTVVPV